MPSFYDNTYHNHYRKPVYDRPEEKAAIEQKRIDEAIYERALPPTPTQEQENAYMDFLAADIRSDPWFTPRFRKYMAGPKRIPWKNNRQIKTEYKEQFLAHMLFGMALAWPLATIIGRRMKHTQGGTPMVPMQRYVHDFPNLEPNHHSKKTFRWYSFLTCGVLGFIFA